MRFKKGDAVWIYFTSEPGNYPGLYHRPGIITKKIHPTSYMVAFMANDRDRPVSEWKLDRHSHEHHPSDLLPYSAAMPFEDNHDNAKERLRELRETWKAEAPQEDQAAWWKSEEERARLNRKLNRTLRPILARMLG